MPEVPNPVSKLTARQRHLGLAAAIACVAVFGLSVGEAAPLLSLLLDRRGTDPTVNGLNAGAAFIGVIIGPLFTPLLLRCMGIRRFLLSWLTLDIAAFLSLHLFPGLGAWFVLRLVLGMAGSAIFTASEGWINLLASGGARGRIIGIYAAALSAGFGLGPLLLTVTGVEGWPPFLANAVITAAASIPLLAIRDAGGGLARERGSSPATMFARAPFIVLVVAMFGLYEASLMTLLPIWGVRVGLGTSAAAAAVSAVYIGAIFLQIPIGWLSDRGGRAPALLVCGLTGLAGAILLPFAAISRPALFSVLVVWGGIAGATYPVALGMAGDRFRGSELVTINAAIVMAYGIGSFAGPALGGAAMDAWNPQGLPAFLALIFLALLAAITARFRYP